MGERVRVGVMILPEHRWAQARVQWQTIEVLGFDSGWTFDHLWWRTLRDQPWFSTFPCLAAAATATTRIRIGTLVTSPNFRHPVVTAKEAMTLDDISNGRFTLGIGAGSTGAGDAHVLDGARLSPADRAARFQEFVELVDQLLRTPVVSHLGHFYTANEARMIPGCLQQPRLPLAIAGSDRRALELAARLGDTWVTCGPVDVSRQYSPEDFHAVVHRQSDNLTRACERWGRNPQDLDRMLVTTDMIGDLMISADAFMECAARYRKLGFTDLVVHWPRPDGVFAADPAALENIANRALSYVQQL